MRKYSTFIYTHDYGGVYIFSGIPNRAFYFASIAFGAWKKAGKIWWRVLTSGQLTPNCTFVKFSNATIDAAKESFGKEEAKIVRSAWNEVGAMRKL
jgi:Zinc metalloprotease (elastase)